MSEASKLELNCPCGVTLSIPAGKVGTVITCPKCKQDRRVTEVCLVSVADGHDGQDFKCECGAPVYVADRLVGKTVKCIQCGKLWKATNLGLVETISNVVPIAQTRPGKRDAAVIGKNAMICTTCGSIGTPHTITRGSFMMEVGLWILILLPGILYSIWRLTTRYKACMQCGGGDLVPVHTPMGKKLREQFRA